MRATTRAFAVGSAAALALVLTACGTDSAGGPAETVSATSAPSDVASDPGQPSTPDGPAELTREQFVDVNQQAMQEVSRYRYTMSATGGPNELSFAYDVVLDDEDTRVGMTMTSQGMEATTVIADGMYYMNLGELSGNKYVIIDPADTQNPLASQLPDPQQLAQAGQNAQFDDALVELEAVGVEEIAGVPAMHYTMTLDTAAYVEAMSGNLGGMLEDAMAQLPETMTSDAWLDAEGRTVQTVSEFQGVTTTMTFGDWDDESVTVEVPPADELIDWQDVDTTA
ncbi:hypothetical protein KIN34_05070 [Cellulomonas sp. DKR-3]|uniref:Lipoprotein n=1 Tax=Cellulomonas fulva TaxID=2835530 RepID=A0ABS5TWY3_9CELL|nr:hypothetical protein [Cellulomonas fulva]MBT0993655.1 hypothetical protein [Cellulomonas fulva]